MEYHKVLINMNELSDLINSQGTVKPKIIIEIGLLRCGKNSDRIRIHTPIN